MTGAWGPAVPCGQSFLGENMQARFCTACLLAATKVGVSRAPMFTDRVTSGAPGVRLAYVSDLRGECVLATGKSGERAGRRTGRQAIGQAGASMCRVSAPIREAASPVKRELHWVPAEVKCQ